MAEKSHELTMEPCTDKRKQNPSGNFKDNSEYANKFWEEVIVNTWSQS